jgi:hypothetical protein
VFHICIQNSEELGLGLPRNGEGAALQESTTLRGQRIRNDEGSVWPHEGSREQPTQRELRKSGVIGTENLDPCSTLYSDNEHRPRVYDTPRKIILIHLLQGEGDTEKGN